MENLSPILEMVMLIAFGASWPMQIAKTIRVKNPMGKSFIFQYLIVFGYICGIISKIYGPADKQWLIWVYLLDLALVSTDLILSHYYLARVKKAAKQAQS